MFLYFSSINNLYFYIFFFLIFVIILSTILFFISSKVVFTNNYFEKISAYECGFEPFEDSRVKFDVRFYLVGILFLIFDIEIMFLYPWVLCFNTLSFISIFSMFIFLMILVLGFVYEWQKGALDWS